MADPETDPTFEIEGGDRVEVIHDVGGFFAPRIVRGARGIVVRRLPDGILMIRFESARSTSAVPERLVRLAPAY